MRWYQGDISAAVATSKANEAVFVVYLEGKDTLSQSLTSLLNDSKICTLLESKHFVAIKIEIASIPHQQFSQIYKQATSPSIYFIGKTGSPLEIVTQAVPPDSFLTTLKNILQKHGVNITSIDENVTAPIETTHEIVCDGDTCTLIPKATTSMPSTSTPEISQNEASSSSQETSALSHDEKVERAKELLQKKREAKLAEEKESERAKEIERRQLGKDVQKMKRWQQENELKELVEERNREKKAEQEAKQRVLAQIAQDKLERAAKFAPVTPSTSTASPSSPQLTRRATNSNTARLQFKLADGTSHTHEFSNATTLSEVRRYIISNLNLPYNSFSLSTTFPRREFTTENLSETLLSLELVPNAVILILPLHNGTVSTNTDSWWSSLFWSFVAPFLSIYTYFRNKLFGAPRRSTSEGKRPNASGEAPNPPKRKVPESTYIRKQGNVHRLTDNNDSDEDNNTWNGNSTQQM